MHAAWEPFCLFLAVIGRHQVTTRNPPSLLSTGDYQLRKRKTGHEQLHDFLFNTCFAWEITFTVALTTYKGGAVLSWHSFSAKVEMCLCWGSAEGSTPLKSSQQHWSVMGEPHGSPSAQAEWPWACLELSLHLQLKLCHSLGLIIVLIHRQLSPAVGEMVARKGNLDSVSPLWKNRGTIETIKTVVSIETSAGATDAAELSLSTASHSQWGVKSLTVGRFRTSPGFGSFHQKELGGLCAIKLPHHM